MKKETLYLDWWDNYPTDLLDDTPHGNPEVGSTEPHFIPRGVPFN